jgi:hypothetical protein
MAEQKHTAYAMQALGFADMFNIKVGDQKVDGHRVELSAPEGQSTGGGKQSLQHVRLVSPSGAVVVAGAASPVDKSAEIRTYEYLVELHAQRFKGSRLELDRAQYQALVGRMQAFFAGQGLRVVMLDAPRPITGPTARMPKPGMSPALIVGIFVAVAAVIAAATFFALRARHGG